MSQNMKNQYQNSENWLYYSRNLQDGRERFFEKSFLLADFKSNIVFGMFFQTINNIDIDFKLETYNKDFISLEIYFQLSKKLNY